MSASLTIQFKVQANDVGLLGDDLRLPSAVEGQGHAAIFKGAARVAPAGGEDAEAFTASRDINPRRASAFFAIGKCEACDA